MSSIYELEYLPLARKDMVDIVQYISQELCNPDAAYKLAEDFIQAAEDMRTFPYGTPVRTSIRPLKQECRKIIVKNYMMFYWVEESTKTVIVARVLYCKRDHKKLL